MVNQQQKAPQYLYLFSVFALLLTGCCMPPGEPDQRELLWPQGAPGALGNLERDRPELLYYFPSPDNANGAAVVIAPGGGYAHHCGINREGVETARWLARQGFTAVVLRYRLGGRANGYTHREMLEDGKQAIRRIRAKAKALGLDRTRIGMMGFSAGGHLATYTAIGAEDCRPDFLILIYPVITMYEPHVHRGSRAMLTGSCLLRGRHSVNSNVINQLSVEKHIPSNMPPVFIAHPRPDHVVDWQNSRLLHDALQAHDVPCELHIFEDGHHGISILCDSNSAPGMATWPTLCLEWLDSIGIFP